MSASYEFWMTDDSGNRLLLLDDFFSASYSRTTQGYGSFQIELSFQSLRKKLNPIFSPDRRVEVWRSPESGLPLRLERSYLLREPRIYTRVEDNIQTITFYGRDGLDLLRRRSVIQDKTTTYASKTDFIDDMMKAIVREQMLYGSARDSAGVLSNARAWPNGEFLVDGDLSLGPSTTKTFQDRNVLDVLKELKDTAFQLGSIVYFDVIETQISGTNRFGWTFRTYSELRGADRTSSVEFSVENENIEKPDYSKSHLEEVNSVYVKNGTTVVNVQDTELVNASRWNLCESVRFGYFEGAAAGLTSIGNAELGENIPKEELDVIFLNNPGGPRSPRSLYGVQWDLGDLLPVSYAGMQIDAEVKIIYVSVNNKGIENITGRTKI